MHLAIFALALLFAIAAFPEAIAVISGLGFLAVSLLTGGLALSGAHTDNLGMWLVFGVPCLFAFIASSIIAGLRG
jgi:hypothetical protein